MSTVFQKRSRTEAIADAEALKALFDPASYSRWKFAGSLRRGRPEVGDVEHVIMPKFGDVAVGGGLFNEAKRTNLILYQLDDLVARGVLSKHVYGSTGFRWGERYRGIDFRGFNHEFFLADETNWGPTLAIRTGPAEFSKRLVSALLGRGMRNAHGQVWRIGACSKCGRASKPADVAIPESAAEARSAVCQFCGQAAIVLELVPVAEERDYFGLTGIAWIEPERRAA